MSFKLTPALKKMFTLSLNVFCEHCGENRGPGLSPKPEWLYCPSCAHANGDLSEKELTAAGSIEQELRQRLEKTFNDFKKTLT